MKILVSILIACACSIATGQTNGHKGLTLDTRLPDFSRITSPGVVVASNTVSAPVFDFPTDLAGSMKQASSLNPVVQALQTPRKSANERLKTLQPAVQARPLLVAPVMTQPVAQPAAEPIPFTPAAAADTVTNPQVKRYELRVSDLTIRAALERWLKADAYQDIVWDLREDLAIDRDAYFEDDLQGAITSVMVALRNTQLPTRACVYSNKVVRVIPATRFCNESTQ